MNAMTRSYLETLIWSEVLCTEIEGGTLEYNGDTYRDGEPLDEMISVHDLPKSSVEQAEKDCAGFVSYVEDALGFDPELKCNPEGVGLNFLLSRSGHGAGFFDSEWEIDGVDYSQELHKAAKTFGTIGLQVWVENDELKIETHG
jgi:hypothetical protein